MNPANPQPARIRCLIIDDEPLAREDMRRLLQAHAGVEIVGDTGEITVALQLTEQHRPDVVLLDVQLRGETGFDYVARVGTPAPGIIFVTAHDRYAVEAFRANGIDYLLKPVAPAQLAEALRRAAERKQPASVTPAKPQPEMLRSLGLTLREAQVLFWIAHGKSNPEIARLLDNSTETVKKQVQSVLNRLGVDNRLAAALIASRHLGILPKL